MKEKLIHLLIPRQFKIWCVQRKPSHTMQFTMHPSKATCANCLTRMRGGKPFRVAHTGPARTLRCEKD
jgi:hypothetical protein